MNPRREEITTSIQRGQARAGFTDASRTQTTSRNIGAGQRANDSQL
jgi:hypothetical protein